MRFLAFQLCRLGNHGLLLDVHWGVPHVGGRGLFILLRKKHSKKLSGTGVNGLTTLQQPDGGDF